MQNKPTHEIAIFPPEEFKALLNHEVKRSRRYGDSLTLIDLFIETDPANLETQHSAEAIAINVFKLHLRETDIPCKRENEFIILMPSTSAPGARTACERILKLLNTECRTDSGTSFRLFAFIGAAAMPMDHSLSSDELTQNASQALQHVRANRITNVIAFSEVLK